MECEGTLLRAAERRPPGDTEAPRGQQQAEATTISSPEEGRAGTVLEGSSKGRAVEKSHLTEAVPEGQRHCQNDRVKQGKAVGKGPCPLSCPARASCEPTATGSQRPRESGQCR